MEDRRIRVYRELVYNSLEGFLSSGFPVIRSLYDDATWHVLVHRTTRDDSAFMELNPVTAHLVFRIQNNEEDTARQLLEQISGELGHADPKVVIQGGLEILEALRERGVLGRTDGSGKCEQGSAK